MKIIKIESYVLKHILQVPFAFAQWWHRERQACIVKIHTDEGIIGWGEANSPAVPTKHMIDSVYVPLLLGQDPLHNQKIWDDLYTRARVFGPGGVTMGALSAIDIALWDIKARFFGVPISILLGGIFRESIKTYATGFFLMEGKQYPAAFVDEAAKLLEEGFTALKVKVGFWGPKKDMENVKAIKNSIDGRGIELMVDANCSYNEYQSTNVSRFLEEIEAYWFEEPMSRTNLEGYVQLHQKSNIALAGGEGFVDRYQFHPWIERPALDIIQPDLCKAGGFTEGLKILDFARIHDKQIIPHVWGTGIAIAAALQFVAAIPNYPFSQLPPPIWFEYDTSVNPLRFGILENNIIRMKHGAITIPETAGLGINIDCDYISSNSIQ